MLESTAKARTLPLVASLVSAPPAALDQGVIRIAGPSFHNVQALLGHAITPDAVVLYPQDAAQAFEWLLTLRSEGRLSLSPIFTVRDLGPAVAALTDGVIDAPATLFAHIGELREKLTTVPAQSGLEAGGRLLAFLYTRPGRTIDPVCQWQSEPIYRYPLVEAFTTRGEPATRLLTSLHQRGLIEPVELVDRVHLCSACRGAHLNYVDVCPQCSSIDIAESIFLHCYTCGHVATQDAFVSSHGLSCPKCLARLRHIGVDYDRALEAFACHACSGQFTEPDVKARCLHCRTLCKTEGLEERRVERFQISHAGQLTARTGHMGELFALMDELSCAHPAYFAQTLDFLLGLARRHPEVQFGLACIRFANLRELLVQLPAVQVSQLVDGFAIRLRELVRTTDLVLRQDDEHCWLLLPQTPAAGLSVLLSRVRQIVGDVVPATGTQLQLMIASASSHNLSNRITDAKLLMAELRSQVE